MNLLSAVVGVAVLVVAIAGQVTHTGLFFVPALVVLAVGGVKLWREQQQARWEDALHARAAIHGCSPVPLLDELLSPFRGEGHQHGGPASPVTDEAAASTTGQGRPEPGGREKMISQIPPKYPEDPTQPARVRPVRRASDLVRHHDQRVELRGFEPLTPSMRTMNCRSNGLSVTSTICAKLLVRRLV